MDHEVGDLEPKRSGSFSQTSSATSFRRHSFSLSFHLPHQEDDDAQSDTVSEAGDIGDRALQCHRHSGSGRLHLSAEIAADSSAVVPIPEDVMLQPNGFWARDPNAVDAVSPLSPTTAEIISVLSKAAIVAEGDKNQGGEKELPWLLEYVCCLLLLAVLGILGVLLRYSLQKLFGPGVVGATSDGSYMYLDLPSNMVGSFLMGWLGVVYKGDIAKVSGPLAIGLTTGFLGSLTTFSGWNQKMIDLSVEGHWVFSVLGMVLGLFLAAYCIIFGIETAKGAKWLQKGLFRSSSLSSLLKLSQMRNNYRCNFLVMVVLLVLLISFWAVAIALEARGFKNGGNDAHLWLACIVGPFGVWIRWYLARLNGRGLGKSGILKWLPFGTLVANVSAACAMAALAAVRKAVNTRDCDTAITGLQFGFLGCLSTVSTFIAEFHAMRQSNHPWRAYAYATATILISFALGTLIYSVPFWTRAWD